MKHLTSMSPLPLYAAFRAHLGAFIGVIVPDQNCRFTPTCSQYCRETIVKHGLMKGSLKCLYRLARCHPLNSGGFDPV